MARPFSFSAWAPVFRVAAMLVFCGTSSAGVTPIHSFNNLPHGGYPYANVVFDSAGNLYGTTAYGGVYGQGTVFEVSPTANGQWKHKILYSFMGLADGCHPWSGVVFDTAGNLYGTTVYGGSNGYGATCYGGGIGGYGVVFKLSPNANGNWTESVIHSFAGTDGEWPTTGVIFDKAGNLYGVVSRAGVVYELSPNSQGQWIENILYSFTGQSDGGGPTGVVLDQAGNLYGGASYGGDLNCNNYGSRDTGCGVIFQLSNNGNGSWTETTLHTFGLFDGAFPNGSPVFDSSGNLYGATTGGPGTGCQYQGCGTIFRMANDGSWSFTSIYTFAGGNDGVYPNGGLVLDQNGNLYGTTLAGGGASGCAFEGCGTAFELEPRSGGVWQEKILRRFGIGTGLDALAVPEGGVIFDQFGNLYGTMGGSVGYSVGAVFKLTPNSSGASTLSSLYTFYPSGDGIFGSYPPAAGVVADSVGNLYGTTQYGGRWSNGTVYEVSPHSDGTWTERVLYSFTGNADGGQPRNSLVIDSAGDLYGTTPSGGSGACPGTCGLVFKLSKTSGSWQQSVIYNFAGATDGGSPGGLVFDTNGNLYGAALGGGPLTGCYGFGCGTVFELSPSANGWQEKTLYFFQGGLDGDAPRSVTFDQAGNLYGVTATGGSTPLTCPYGCGTVFELTPASSGWTKKTLYSFAGNKDGYYPYGVAVDSAGNLYGTTYYGGVDGRFCGAGCGTVFELSTSTSGPWSKTTLYSFQPEQVPGDGAHPSAAVTLDPAGNLYGTTYGLNGGPQGGTVFKLTAASSGAWSETILGDFSVTNGELPEAPLILDSAGNLFGTASGGGTIGLGVVFEIPASEINAPHSSATTSEPLLPTSAQPTQLQLPGVSTRIFPPGLDYWRMSRADSLAAGGKLQ